LINFKHYLLFLAGSCYTH